MGPKGLASSLLLFLFVFQNFHIYHAENILFFWGMSGSGYSHRITVWPLNEKPAARGHNHTIQSFTNKMQAFIDSFDDGFIYFSFVTYMKLPLLPESHKNAIFGAIQKFPNVGFVMKWNGGEVPDNLPANVYTAEWLTQQDILSQPKVRAFIAHGGLLGTQEAVFKSMIVYPIFAKQDYNAQRIHTAERSIQMEISELTEEKLENAIREVLTNKRYKENMEKTSKIFLDRPESPSDTAVWWVEYVLRHKETPFLKLIGLDRTWYEKRVLPIWGFVGVTFSSGLVLMFVILRLLK